MLFSKQLAKKPNFAYGPDNFPPLLFKRLGGSLAVPFSMRFSSFFSVGQIPDAWSKAIITPIYKSGNPSDPANYRPVSLTCVACKIMEKITVAQMLDYLRDNSLITRHQHGFLSCWSTVSNLLECVNDWMLKLNDKHGVMVAYIDYAKAFHVVIHSKLMYKLKCMALVVICLSGSELSWQAGHSIHWLISQTPSTHTFIVVLFKEVFWAHYCFCCTIWYWSAINCSSVA